MSYFNGFFFHITEYGFFHVYNEHVIQFVASTQDIWPISIPNTKKTDILLLLLLVSYLKIHSTYLQ